ncbi:MAG: hypothetical protein OHK0031_17810 [Anaerolineales bacterium]
MKSPTRFSFILIALIFLALASLALQPIVPAAQSASTSPTPTMELAGKAALEIQPGSSDGIFALGLFIWLMIVLPVFFLRKNFLH